MVDPRCRRWALAGVLVTAAIGLLGCGVIPSSAGASPSSTINSIEHHIATPRWMSVIGALACSEFESSKKPSPTSLLCRQHPDPDHLVRLTYGIVNGTTTHGLSERVQRVLEADGWSVSPSGTDSKGSVTKSTYTIKGFGWHGSMQVVFTKSFTKPVNGKTVPTTSESVQFTVWPGEAEEPHAKTQARAGSPCHATLGHVASWVTGDSGSQRLTLECAYTGTHGDIWVAAKSITTPGCIHTTSQCPPVPLSTTPSACTPDGMRQRCEVGEPCRASLTNTTFIQGTTLTPWFCTQTGTGPTGSTWQRTATTTTTVPATAPTGGPPTLTTPSVCTPYGRNYLCHSGDPCPVPSSNTTVDPLLTDGAYLTCSHTGTGPTGYSWQREPTNPGASGG